MNIADQVKTEIIIVNHSNEAGKQLKALGDIAGIKRY